LSIVPVVVGHHRACRCRWREIPPLRVPRIQRLTVSARIVDDAIGEGRGALKHYRIKARLPLSGTGEIDSVESSVANPKLVVPLMMSGHSNAKLYDGTTAVSLLWRGAH
jgi:hypothetical protein